MSQETVSGTGNRKGVGQAYVLFATSLLLVLTIGSVAQLASLVFGLAFTELALILLPAILFVRWKRLPIAGGLRWRRVPAPVALLSVAVGVTGWGMAAAIQHLTVPILGEAPGMPGVQLTSMPQLLLMLVVGAVLPGVCEEALFRGAIQGVLRRRGTAKAVVITAILFGVYHMNPWSLVPAFFLGLVFGTMTARTGSVVPSTLAHVANNATAFIVGFALADQPDATARVAMAVLAAAFCVLFAVFWRRTRDAAPAPPALAAVPAGLPRSVAWIGGVAAGAAVLAAAAVIAVAVALLDVYTVTDDALEPAVHRGDRLLVSTRNLEKKSFDAWHIIAVERDGEVVLRRITRVDGETIWIAEEPAGEQAISRDRIVGRVIHNLSAGGSGPEPAEP